MVPYYFGTGGRARKQPASAAIRTSSGKSCSLRTADCWHPPATTRKFFFGTRKANQDSRIAGSRGRRYHGFVLSQWRNFGFGRIRQDRSPLERLIGEENPLAAQVPGQLFRFLRSVFQRPADPGYRGQLCSTLGLDQGSTNPFIGG